MTAWTTDAAKPWRRTAVRVVALAAAMMLGSCKTPSFLCVKPSGLRHLAIQTDATIDNGLAPRIDLLFITDKAVLKTVKQKTAAEYFDAKKQLNLDYPKAITTKELGLRSKQYLDPTKRSDMSEDMRRVIAIDPPCNLAGTLLFVDYNNDAPNRVALTKAKSGTLELHNDSFVYRRR